MSKLFAQILEAYIQACQLSRITRESPGFGVVLGLLAKESILPGKKQAT